MNNNIISIFLTPTVDGILLELSDCNTNIRPKAIPYSKVSGGKNLRGEPSNKTQCEVVVVLSRIKGNYVIS